MVRGSARIDTSIDGIRACKARLWHRVKQGRLTQQEQEFVDAVKRKAYAELTQEEKEIFVKIASKKMERRKKSG